MPAPKKPERIARKPMGEAAQLAEQRRAIEAEQSAEETAVETSSPAQKRVPFGAARTRLDAPQRPGFYRRWFSDTAGRIFRAQEAGYQHVIDERTGKPVQAMGGTNPEGGGGLRQYLMEIPEEWRKADFEAQQKSLDEVDKAIYSGRHNEETGDKRYLPSHTPMSMRVVTGPGRG